MDTEIIIPGRSVICRGKNLRKPALPLFIAFVSFLMASTVAWARIGTPAVGVSPTSISFGSYTVGTTSAPDSLTVTNTGTATLTITSIALKGGNSSDFSESNNCGKSLAAKANCLVQVTFKPTAAGTRTTTLDLSDSAMNSPQKVTIRGSATTVTATVSLSATSFSFGTYVVGTTAGPESLSVTNSGTTTLSITSVTFSGGNSGDFTQTNNCGVSLAVGANCLVQVMFTPSAAGTRTTTLYVADNATGSPQQVTFSGSATAATAAASLSATLLSFGNESVGTTSAIQTVTLTNTGNAALTVTSITVSGTNASDFAQTNTCGSSLTASTSCAISISFKPSAAGTRAAIVSVADSATGGPPTITLSGTGICPATSLSPSTLSFGNQSVNVASGAQTITLSNTGNAALSVTAISISGTNATDFSQTNNCGSSVAAGSSCTISVIFTPAASGSRAASLAIADNATGSPQPIALTGTGTVSAASVSPSSLTYGSLSVGTTSAAQIVTLSNTGNGALSVTSISFSGTNGTDFSETNNCGASVPASSSCTISVVFTPAAAGSRVASLAIADSATGSPQCIAISATGTSTSGSATLSPNSLTFSSQAVEMSSPTQTMTLANTGTTALTISGIAIAGTASSDFTQNNNCGSSVAAGATCTIVVLFTPSAAGVRPATISISDNAASSPQTAALSGTGTHDVMLNWSASSSSNVSGYFVYRGTTSGGEGSTPLNSTPICATAYTDQNVTSGSQYYYIVTSVASNGVTQSAASTETAASVPSP